MPIRAKSREGISREIMGKFKRGELHSGSGDIVDDPRQAKAILLSTLRERRFKVKKR